MAKSIFEALFYGKINLSARHVKHNRERMEIEKAIKAEKEFFRGELVPDLYQRLETLESLYTQAGTDEEVDVFTRGVALGMHIVIEMMAQMEDMFNE